MRTLHTLLMIVALTALIAAGCGSSDDTSTSTSTGTDAAAAADAASTDTTAVKPPAGDTTGAETEPVDTPTVGSDIAVPADVDAPEDIVELAILAWLDAVESDVDMTSGPCLGVIADGWVADVAHSPRTAVDNERANQCDAFHSGEATNFIEVTEQGVPFNINGTPLDVTDASG